MRYFFQFLLVWRPVFRTLAPLGDFFFVNATLLLCTQSVIGKNRCLGTSGNLNTQSLLDTQCEFLYSKSAAAAPRP